MIYRPYWVQYHLCSRVDFAKAAAFKRESSALRRIFVACFRQDFATAFYYFIRHHFFRKILLPGTIAVGRTDTPRSSRLCVDLGLLPVMAEPPTKRAKRTDSAAMWEQDESRPSAHTETGGGLRGHREDGRRPNGHNRAEQEHRDRDTGDRRKRRSVSPEERDGRRRRSEREDKSRTAGGRDDHDRRYKGRSRSRERDRDRPRPRKGNIAQITAFRIKKVRFS